jgi:DNA-binding GntR family transcriptional regulator
LINNVQTTMPYALAMADLALALQRFHAEPRTTAHEAIVRGVRGAILSGELAPGTRLVQTELAAQFGVSNTPVREALRQLSAEGLVQFDAFRGAIVRQPTLDEIRDAYELVATLEPLAARRAATRMGDEELVRLRDLHARMCATTDTSAWAPLNREFHDVIEQAAGSARLTSILAGLRDARMMRVLMGLDEQPRTIAESNREHAELVDAFDARDAERAAEAMVRHLGASLAAVERQLAAAEGDG